MPHIEVPDVSLIYDTPAGQVPGVEGASFDIEASEFLCLVGPSGLRQVTLLNIIAGFLRPTARRDPHRRQGGHRPRASTAAWCSRISPSCFRGARRSAT